jgi:hypothetical protein
MAFAPALIPYVTAAAAIYSGAKQQQSADYNAQVMKQEQGAAVNQATAQEGLVRRNSREMLGRQAAAFGGAGVGYSGSSGVALDQSAINQELDALNTRYRGAITGYGYGVQSDILKREGKDAMIAGVLMAGGSALKNLPSYGSGLKSPGEMSGLISPQPPSGLGGPG